MAEQRGHERYPLVVGSDIESSGTDTRFGLTQDLSRSGARLLTQARYEAETRLSLQIHLDKTSVTELKAVVVRGSQVPDRGMWRYEVGVRFEELLPQDLVEALRELSRKLGW